MHMETHKKYTTYTSGNTLLQLKSPAFKMILK